MPPSPADPSPSRSIGRPSLGHLLFGIPIAETTYLGIKPGSRRTAYGTLELVRLLDYAAHVVDTTFPGSRLAVGDLSREGGGRLRPHRSHRTGRDADVGFYLVDAEGNPAYTGRFVRVHPTDDEMLRFDTPRNWAFLRAMLEYPDAAVQYVFVSRPLVGILLDEARRTGASEELVSRAADVMSHHARGHDNHFHVRIHCPADDRECEDREPPRHRRPSGHGHRAPAVATIDV